MIIYPLLEADLTEENQVSNLSKIVIKRFNQIDILVNNAGMVQTGNDQPTKKIYRAFIGKLELWY